MRGIVNFAGSAETICKKSRKKAVNLDKGTIAVGAVIGELLRLDERLEKLGGWIERKCKKREDDKTSVTEGFVSASLLFCVGAMTILTSVMQFAMLPLQGLAQGAQPILSYNYGAKNAGRVRKAFQLLLISSLVYSTLLWSAIQIFPSVFASIFTPNEELIVFAAKALRIYCGVLVLFGIQIACQMTFVSLGNAPCSIIVAVVRKFVLLIPLIYIMPQLVSDQAMGVYMAEPVADVIAVTFTAILFSRQFRKSMTALELEAKNSDA